MNLTQLRLRDFRAFSNVTVDLPYTGLVLISGPNNAGKSAFFSALDVVAGGPTPPAAARAGASGPSVVARFRPTEVERQSIIAGNRAAAPGNHPDLASWLEWEFTDLDGQLTATSLKCAWNKNQSVTLAQIQTAGHAITVQGIPTNTTINNWDGTTLQQRIQTTKHSGSSYSDLLLINYPELEPAQSALTKWRQRYYHFLPLRRGSERRLGLTAVSTLSPDGSDLANFILHLLNNEPAMANRLNELIDELVPEVGQLVVSPQGGEFELGFADPHIPGYRHNIKDLGTGVEQLVMTLSLGLTRAAPYLLMLEEPETGLHPTAQRALLTLLKQWADDRLILAATHSSVMLDWTPDLVSVKVVERRGGESVIRDAAEPVEAVRALGARLSDIVAAERVLLVEGPSDRAILSTWFPDMLRSPRVAVLEGEGGYNARYVGRFGRWLKDMYPAESPRVLYVRDRDELAPNVLAKLQRDGLVAVLPRRELENYLLDGPALASVISDERLAAGSSGVSAEAVDQEMSRLAEGLKRKVIIGRVASHFAPLRWISDDDRTTLVDQGAGEVETVAFVAGKLPRRSSLQGEVRQAWRSAEREVEQQWADEWRSLVPAGALLDALWRHFLGRNYRKQRDGLRIAAALDNPPAELGTVLQSFMSA